MRKRLGFSSFLGLWVSSIPLTLPAQQRVDPANQYERVICIVPMVGRGVAGDARRPLFVPGPGEPLGGILGYTYVMSDDGSKAIVEIVGRDRKALAAILASQRADVKVFLKGRDRKEDIEREVRRVKAGFDVAKLGRGGR